MSRTARWLPAALAVLSLSVSGCAPRMPESVAMGFTPHVWTNDGLYLVQRKGPGALFLAQPPLDLKQYDSVILEDIQLKFKEGADEFLPIIQTRTVSMVRRNIRRTMSSHGWAVIDRPGPSTLRARITILEIDVESVYLRGLSFAAPSGSVAIVLELRDSVDDRRLLVYAQNRSLPFGLYSGPGRPEAQRMADAFFEYSIDLFRVVDKAEGGELLAPVLLSGRAKPTR